MASSVTIGVVLIAAGVIWFATTTRGAPQPDVYPTGLRSVIPGEGSQSPRQAAIGAALGPGWAPTVFVNGTPIPRAQLDAGTVQLGEFFFLPGEDKVIDDIRPGRNCARVTATPNIDIEADDFEFSWCWTAF